MTPEELKLENDKLNARLAKAVEVFKEQKANIEALTKERDELKAQLNEQENIVDYDKSIQGLNEQLQEVQHENKQLKDQINSLQFNEESDADVINNYAEEVNKYKNTVDLLNKSIDELNNQITSKDKAYKVLQETYNELFGDNEKLKEQLEQRIKQVRVVENTTNEEVKKVTAARDEWITKYKNLENQLKAARDEITSLHGQLVKSESDADILRKSDKEYREAYEQQKKENKETEEQFNRVLKTYEDDIEKYKEEIKELNITLGEAEEKYSKLGVRFEKLENEKNQTEADMLAIEESYKLSVLNADVNAKLQEQLYDTLLLIRNTCDKVLPHGDEPTVTVLPVKPTPKVNTTPAPQKAVNTSTGNQFMSDEPALRI